jgi:UDP-3-O-[3-hydroxymyristoyl] glucosamine N-acyltransferase
VGSSVVISGNVNIGKKVIIGGQSFISNNLNICSNVVIAPGSVVLSDIKKPGIYNGNMLVKPF